MQVLVEKLPHVKFLTDTTGGTLIAWVTEADHKTITGILDSLAAGPDDQHKPMLKIYPVGDADPTTVSTVVQTVVADAKITPDPKTDALAIWATPDDHELIQSTVEMMMKQAEGEGADVVIVYELPSVGAAAGARSSESARGSSVTV